MHGSQQKSVLAQTSYVAAHDSARNAAEFWGLLLLQHMYTATEEQAKHYILRFSRGDYHFYNAKVWTTRCQRQCFEGAYLKCWTDQAAEIDNSDRFCHILSTFPIRAFESHYSFTLSFVLTGDARNNFRHCRNWGTRFVGFLLKPEEICWLRKRKRSTCRLWPIRWTVIWSASRSWWLTWGQFFFI